MSRRDGRDSDTRRHRSRFDQEPSPKRSRRDGKLETERTHGDVSPKRSRRDGKLETERTLGDFSPKRSRRDGKLETERTLGDFSPKRSRRDGKLETERTLGDVSPKRSRRNGKPETERTLGDVSPKRSRRDGKPETERTLVDVSPKRHRRNGKPETERTLVDVSPKRSRRDGKPETERTLVDVSPKRSRRDGKPETERTLGDVISNEHDNLSSDQKQRRRLQVTGPLETPSKEFPKEELILNKESDKGREGQKYSSNPTDVPRSRSFFQHDERGNSGVAGRSFKHRTSAEGGWQRDSKDQQIIGAKTLDERVGSRARENDAWRHDKFLETEADLKPPTRKRPSFREKKTENDSEKTVVEPVKTTKASEQSALENERRDERGGNGSSRHLDRYERPISRGEANNLGETRRGGNFPIRGRYGGFGSRSGGGYNHREREQLVGRQGGGGYHGGGGGRVEKWKHDLFYEANRSPSPKNEEDAIAKVEALLAS